MAAGARYRFGRWLPVLCMLAPGVAPAAEALLLFGGRHHDEYMGCLNCGPNHAESVCNVYGDYGSLYGVRSIWNKDGEYGALHGAKSPWNRYNAYPPVIADKDGGVYGFFSANPNQQYRTRIETLLFMLDNPKVVVNDMQKARAWLCDD